MMMMINIHNDKHMINNDDNHISYIIRIIYIYIYIHIYIYIYIYNHCHIMYDLICNYII